MVQKLFGSASNNFRPMEFDNSRTDDMYVSTTDDEYVTTSRQKTVMFQNHLGKLPAVTINADSSSEITDEVEYPPRKLPDQSPEHSDMSVQGEEGSNHYLTVITTQSVEDDTYTLNREDMDELIYEAMPTCENIDIATRSIEDRLDKLTTMVFTEVRQHGDGRMDSQSGGEYER